MPQVNYPPYLFEAVLADKVDYSKGTANVGNGAVLFKLYKKSPGLWEVLRSAESGKTVKSLNIQLS